MKALKSFVAGDEHAGNAGRRGDETCEERHCGFGTRGPHAVYLDLQMLDRAGIRYVGYVEKKNVANAEGTRIAARGVERAGTGWKMCQSYSRRCRRYTRTKDGNLTVRCDLTRGIKLPFLEGRKRAPARPARRDDIVSDRCGTDE